MKASILITGEKKENYLIQTINSCLNQNYSNYEIILLYTHLRNLEMIKNKFKSKIIFKQVKNKTKNPVKDQIKKIFEGIKIANGEFIFLLDGDDLFKRNKLKEIIKLSMKDKLNIDDHILVKNKKFTYVNKNKLKNLSLFKYLINPWPDKICTSCISGNKNLFRHFFKTVDISKYKYLAIDVLITLFYINKINNVNNIFTIKKVLPNSVDSNYSNLFKKIYWERRIEQHKYLKEIKSINFSLEFYLSKFISLLLNFNESIQKRFQL